MKKYVLIACIACSIAGCKTNTQFELVNAVSSGIHFNNLINDNDSLNILDVENLYNGGGVGIGDFNNDGMQDIYFTANATSNKLYLNKGNFKFEDITEKAGVTGDGRWSRGVSVVDINNDGRMDIYIAASLMKDSKKRENLLYVNEGINEAGIPVFKNKAAEYGLNDTSHSTMAAFFDYDNDGDLDMYLLINEITKSKYPNTFRPILNNSENPNTDKLFRNDWNDSLKHPIFTDISQEAGITIEGYGHGVNITDINLDGWKDIYVTNDFLSTNILYINQHNGQFKNQVGDYFKHTAENAMGQDIIDINNDGLADVVELDMNPEDNFRKKMMMNSLSYRRYQNNTNYGYQHQYVRNILQVNQGPSMMAHDSLGAPVFSEVAFYAGMAETDWSWTPIVTDFDNDGFRDIIITNGFPKDVTDHDFMLFRSKASSFSTKKEILDEIPKIKISNYAYKNKGDLSFTDVTATWGMQMSSFSNGAAYADLDNDGDMDIVINNINDEAAIYKNHEQDDKDNGNHYLQVAFKGDAQNIHGIGALVELHYDKGKQQVYENTPYRGYLSTIQDMAHFGLGKLTLIDTILITWPGGKKQLLKNIQPDQLLTVDIKNAAMAKNIESKSVAAPALFTEVTSDLNVTYMHHDSDFVDFNIQKLLPHKFSEYGPSLAVGDIDGNGTDDIMIGGSYFYSAQMLLQEPTGSFIQRSLLGSDKEMPGKKNEDLGVLLFDADGDNDLDLYIASGGYEAERQSTSYQDKFYVNDGQGNFRLDSLAIPMVMISKSCVRAVDYDNDGDLDLFVAGRVDPGNYPRPVSSFIFRNDSKNGAIKFTDVTLNIAAELNKAGLVCDALFTDFDNDGWQDMILAGEWMPARFFKNNKGRFTDITTNTGIDKFTGFWNTIAPGDFDNDGDMDYVIGNMGENSFYKGNEVYPMSIYAKDFDKNGVLECIPTKFLKDKEGHLKEYTTHLRDDVIDQMPFIKKRFLTYKSFAEASFEQLFTKEEIADAIALHANYFKSVYVENKGNNKFQLHPLPIAAQLSVLNGMVVEDFDADGNLDIVINANDFGTDVAVGRYDAMNGLFLKGDGKGNFYPLSIAASGIFIPGNGKALVEFKNPSGQTMLAASQNKGPLKIVALKKAMQYYPVQAGDVAALIKYKNGLQQRKEFPYGSSFLSQSGRYIMANSNVIAIEIFDYKGNKRNISLK